MALVEAAGLPVELQYIQYEHKLESQYLPAIRALISNMEILELLLPGQGWNKALRAARATRIGESCSKR